MKRLPSIEVLLVPAVSCGMFIVGTGIGRRRRNASAARTSQLSADVSPEMRKRSSITSTLRMRSQWRRSPALRGRDASALLDRSRGRRRSGLTRTRDAVMQRSGRRNRRYDLTDHPSGQAILPTASTSWCGRKCRPMVGDRRIFNSDCRSRGGGNKIKMTRARRLIVL